MASPAGRTAIWWNGLRLRNAAGTVLDYLHVITPDTARSRLGLPSR